MNYLRQPEHPRILMLDCADELVAAVSDAGYGVEVGCTGAFVGHPVELPSGLHEKDLLIIDCEPGWERRPADELYPLEGGNDLPDHFRVISPVPGGGLFFPLEAFITAFRRGALVVCLLEAELEVGASPSWQSFQWLAGSNVTSALLSDDKYLRLAEGLDELAALEALLRDHAQELRGVRVLAGGDEPLLVNDAGQTKALWARKDAGGFLYLPYFERKPAAVRRLLRDVLPEISLELFPPRSEDWTEDDAYQLSGVLDVRRRRTELTTTYEAELAQLDAEEVTAREEQGPFLSLLTAESHDLRIAVHQALDWLEFEDVVDEDARRASAGIKDKEEDLHLKDDDYFALVEVTSGRGNARESDFQDLQKYIHRRQRAPGRDDITPLAIRGLLVMNQHATIEPARRPDLYEGNPNDYPELAEELGVGLLSTWELFKTIRAVMDGSLTKAAARELLKRPGLVRAPNSAESG